MRVLPARIWDALKPPPATHGRRLTPQQRRLLIALGSGIALAAPAIGGWLYVSSAPDRAQAQFEQGVHLMTPGNYAEAVKRLDRSIAIWPHIAQAYFDRGVAHRILGDNDAALVDFAAAIAENPKLGAAYTERASILRERGDLDHALEDFNRAVEVEPSANGYYQLGQTYASMGQARKAIEDFDHAIAELRDAPYIYRARAEAKRSLGDTAGYQADRDLAVQAEYRELPRAWVDQPLPGDSGAGRTEEATPAKAKPATAKRKPRQSK